MASRSLGVLTLDMVVKLGGYVQGMDRAARETERSMKRIEGAVVGAQRGFALLQRGFAAVGLGLGLGAIVRATAEAERSFALLQQAVENNAGAAGKSAQELAAVATELQHVSTFSDEAIQDVEALLLSFRSIRGDNFERATQAALDLGTALRKDLPAAALQIGKALEDPARGMTQLARAGVVFNAEQRRLIKSLTDTGRVAEAQGIILRGIEERYQGAAAAARDNFGGALEGLRHDLENLLEVKGGLPAATDAINSFSKTVQDPRVKRGIDLITSSLITLGAVAVKAFAGAAEGVATLTDYIQTLATVAASGLPLSVDLNQDEIRTLLDGLEARLKEKQKSYLVLIPTKLQKLEIAELERQIAHLKGLQVNIPVNVGTAGGGPLPPVISDKDQAAIDKLIESAKSAQQIRVEAVDELNRLVKLSPEQFTPEVFMANIRLIDEAFKKATEPKKTRGANEIEAARKAIDNLVASLGQQATVTGESEEATIRYRIAFGDLRDEFEKAGPAFAERKQDLIDAARAADEFKASEELRKATEQISEQVVELQAQRIALEQGAAAAVAFRAAHGELGTTLDLATSSQEEYTEALRQRQAAEVQLERETAISSIEGSIRAVEAETASIQANEIAMRDGAVAALRFRIAQGDLEAVFDDVGAGAAELQRRLEAATAAQEELNARQQALAASEQLIPSRVKATREYEDALKGLKIRLDEGEISQREFALGVKRAEQNLKEATKALDEMSVFAEQAARNVQDALAEFLFDPFEEGLEGMVTGIADTLRRMAAEIAAAKLAELFNLEDLLRGGIGGLGGGGGVEAGVITNLAPLAISAQRIPELAPIEVTAERLPELGGAEATAAALSSAGTAVASALSAAATSAAAALTTSGTTAATALTTAGTTVAGAITAAGTAAAAAIGAAAATGGAAGGLEEIVITAARLEAGGYAKPGALAVVGDAKSGAEAPELLVAGRSTPEAALERLLAPAAPILLPGQVRVAGVSGTGREAPELIQAGPAGVTVVPLREVLRERERSVARTAEARTVERTLRAERSSAILERVLGPATVERLRERLRERGLRYVGAFAAGGYVPPGAAALVGDAPVGGVARREAPEVLIGGRAEMRDRGGFVAVPPTLGWARPPTPERPIVVGDSPDGQARPALVYGGSRGITVLPLRESRHRAEHSVERLLERWVPGAATAERYFQESARFVEVRGERRPFAGRFASGGYIPPGSYGVVGDSLAGNAVARELLLSGALGVSAGGATGADGNWRRPLVQNITINAPNGEVSRPTLMQTTAAAARGARIADRRQN